MGPLGYDGSVAGIILTHWFLEGFRVGFRRLVSDRHDTFSLSELNHELESR